MSNISLQVPSPSLSVTRFPLKLSSPKPFSIKAIDAGLLKPICSGIKLISNKPTSIEQLSGLISVQVISTGPFSGAPFSIKPIPMQKVISTVHISNKLSDVYQTYLNHPQSLC